MTTKAKKPDSIKALLDVSDFPPAIYHREKDGRKGKYLRGLRQRFAMMLAKFADADGSNIKVSAERLAGLLEISRRLVNYLFEDFRELKFLHDGGFDSFYKTRIRTLDVAAMRRAAARLNPAHVQNSASPVQDSEPHVQNSNPEGGAKPSILHTTAFDSTAHITAPPYRAAPQNGAGEGREVCVSNPNPATMVDELQRNLPYALQESIWLGPNKEEKLPSDRARMVELLKQHGVVAIGGALRAWLIRTDSTKYIRGFLDTAAMWITPQATEAEAERLYALSPECAAEWVRKANGWREKILADAYAVPDLTAEERERIETITKNRDAELKPGNEKMYYHAWWWLRGGDAGGSESTIAEAIIEERNRKEHEARAAEEEKQNDAWMHEMLGDNGDPLAGVN
jgi:hypothetical protein